MESTGWIGCAVLPFELATFSYPRDDDHQPILAKKADSDLSKCLAIRAAVACSEYMIDEWIVRG
jgi:hypothetical protein